MKTKHEEVNQITRTVIKEEFEVVCSDCGKRITGSTKNQVVFNLATHKKGKACFEQRVQNELPERTPNYQSPVSKEEDTAVSKEIDKLDKLSSKDENVSTEDVE